MRTPPVTILPDELLHRIFCFVQSEPLSTAPLPSSRRAGSLSTAPSAPATSLGNAISFQLARIRASLECLRNQNGQAERISQRMDQMGLYGLSTDRSSPELMASRARVAALRSFSLVHRRWTPIAQRLLFSSVAITHELQAKEMFHSLTPRTHRFQSLSITGVSNGAVEALLSRVQAVAQLRLALVQESHNAVGFQGSMLLSPGLKDLDTLVLGDPFRFTDWPDSWPTHLRRLSITSSAFFDSSEQGHSRPVTRHLPPTLSELHFRMRGADQLPHQLHLLIEALPSNSVAPTPSLPDQHQLQLQYLTLTLDIVPAHYDSTHELDQEPDADDSLETSRRIDHFAQAVTDLILSAQFPTSLQHLSIQFIIPNLNKVMLWETDLFWGRGSENGHWDWRVYPSMRGWVHVEEMCAERGIEFEMSRFTRDHEERTFWMDRSNS